MSAPTTQAGPTRAAMLNLQQLGFAVREVWMDDYYDGLIASKAVGDHRVEVYTGGADDGAHSDHHYPAVVYVDDRRVASDLQVERAARVADIRVSMLRAAIASAGGRS